MAEVPAALGLGGIERRVQPDRHERILQRRPRARVRVDVAGRHARDPEPPAKLGQPPVASAIVAQERALQLDPQPLGSERVAQSPQRELIVDAAQRASAQADEPLGVCREPR